MAKIYGAIRVRWDDRRNGAGKPRSYEECTGGDVSWQRQAAAGGVVRGGFELDRDYLRRRFGGDCLGVGLGGSVFGGSALALRCCAITLLSREGCVGSS